MIFSSLLSYLFGRRETPSLWAIIEVQSGLVRGTLFSSSSGNAKSFSKVHTLVERIPHRERFVTGHVGRPIMKAFRHMTEKLVTAANDKAPGQKIARAHLVLTSPWIISQIKRSNIVFETPVTLTLQNIEGFVAAGASEARSEFRDMFDAVIVEQKLFEISLNGYSIQAADIDRNAKKGHKDGSSKRADRLGLSYAVSATSVKEKEDFEYTLEDAFHTKDITIHSSSLLQYAALRDNMPDKHTYLAIHCHRELTDLLLVRNGNCECIASIPFGTDACIQKAATALNLSPDTAETKISMYVSKTLETSEVDRVRPVLDTLSKEWFDACVTVLKKDQPHLRIPSTIILSADKHVEFIQSSLCSQTPAEVILFQKMMGDVDMYAEVISRSHLIQ